MNHCILHFLKNRELDELYACMALRALALSMISVFIPIFLMKLGYSLKVVLLFYALAYSTHFLFITPTSKIASRIGFKHCMFFSTPLLVGFYFLLYMLESHTFSPYILAVILGISNCLFWTSFHTDFSMFSKLKDRGKQVGFRKLVIQGANILGPAMGGIILTVFGFNVLFVIVSIFLLLSTTPLFFSKDIYKSTKISISNVFNKRTLRDALGNIGFGMETGANIAIWPVFVFFVIADSYTILGFVRSISFMFATFAVIASGYFTDINRRLMLRVGALFTALIWIGKAIVNTIGQVLFVDSLHGMSKMMTAIPYDALCYDKAGQKKVVEGIMFKELMATLGRTIFFLISAFILSLKGSMILASAASLLYLLF